jgi:RNA polymerase sigma factor (TIGR02999 family)
VVHEAFVRLVGMDVPWQDRVHFFAVAARLMRRILVDHAKGRQRTKRGGTNTVVSFGIGEDSGGGASSAGEIDVLEIDDALERLAQRDARLAQIVELHYFAGLTYGETALALDISEATVHRDLRMAKAWILSQIKATEPTS